MASIPQKSLFNWQDLENVGDLQRFFYVIDNLGDEPIIRQLRKLRGKGRNDYPIYAMWNSIIAGVVFQHVSINSLRRELLRNDRLRQLCGFDPVLLAEDAVPKPCNYSRFLKNILKCEKEITEMFNRLVSKVKEILPDFGSFLAHDGKAIQTHARQKKEGYKSPDGRRDTDANLGVKKYTGVTKDGKSWETFKTWFGYKLHLIIDANYELPIAFELTKASEAEPPKAHDLIDRLANDHPDIISDAAYFTSDKGNDDGKLIEKLIKQYKIKPIVGIRNMWKGEDKTRGLSTGENVCYDYEGNVFCVCPKSGDMHEMKHGGFEKDRTGHKYLCPARQAGITCKGMSECQIYKKRYVRISCKEDRRIFVPVARSTYKWEKLYKKRTSVERVNSRIDEVFGFEKHFIRGLKKMKMRLSLAFCVMLAMAIGKIKDNKNEIMRSMCHVT